MVDPSTSSASDNEPELDVPVTEIKPPAATGTIEGPASLSGRKSKSTSGVDANAQVDDKTAGNKNDDGDESGNEGNEGTGNGEDDEDEDGSRVGSESGSESDNPVETETDETDAVNTQDKEKRLRRVGGGFVEVTIDEVDGEDDEEYADEEEVEASEEEDDSDESDDSEEERERARAEAARLRREKVFYWSKHIETTVMG